MIQYSKILHYKYQGSEWSIDNEDYSTLQWFSAGAKPSQDELDALWGEVQEIVAGEPAAAQAIVDSVKLKLSAIGLTDTEIKVLFGH
jgi:hypothetical protein